MSLTKLLFVDDEAAFVEAMVKRLGLRGIEVIPAYSGPEALQKLEEKTDVEVVILDIKMPGMDGIEVLREIKTRFPLVEVIMLTGHATVETAIEGMKQAAFDYLMKPCDIDVLVEKVTEACARKRDHEDKIMQARLKEITSRRA
jgi:DNA-binding NtrC family response regulator